MTTLLRYLDPACLMSWREMKVYTASYPAADWSTEEYQESEDNQPRGLTATRKTRDNTFEILFADVPRCYPVLRDGVAISPESQPEQLREVWSYAGHVIGFRGLLLSTAGSRLHRYNHLVITYGGR
ncbi:hypothetical protein RRF57_002199 [Xylaria bambusicola]|uniref:Uncharacterized protein n=1 Tax=Xylaria bambusicola TaxID=326684 RepID=A0AAN7UCN1_9PEZI